MCWHSDEFFIVRWKIIQSPPKTSTLNEILLGTRSLNTRAKSHAIVKMQRSCTWNRHLTQQPEIDSGSWYTLCSCIGPNCGVCLTWKHFCFSTENDIQFEERTGNHICILFWPGHENIPFREVTLPPSIISFNMFVHEIQCDDVFSRSMLQSGEWPTNMQYLTCDDYDGTNTPERNIDLRTAFVSVNEPPTYGNFSFASPKTPFNGHSWMKFIMEMSAVSVQGGASVSTKPLGNWTADISGPITVNSVEEMANMSAAVVYRVFTVVVSALQTFPRGRAKNWLVFNSFAATAVHHEGR